MCFNLEFLWLSTLGLFAGGYGTLIGAGGGFILAPALLLIYPRETPQSVAVISLGVVLFNSLSGTLAYLRSGRIDYKSGWLFAAATMPGAIIGALTTAQIGRALFNLAFGSLLVLVGVFSLVNPGRNAAAMAHAARDGKAKLSPLRIAVALCLGLLLGFISSFLGIGGGFLYVPALIYLLDFPIHTATATSLFILTLTSFAGSLTHWSAGLFDHGLRQVVPLAIGAIVGAQVAARFSRRLHGEWLIRGLAGALILVGLRLIAIAL